MMVRLDCEIYSPGKRAADAEKQHEAIKNCELSGLDLLVREMVQNSLDAALDENKKKAVSVCFTRGLFNVNAFANSLGEETTGDIDYSELLLAYLNKENVPNSFLAIRDFGCVGLDGDVSDRKSRAWKLPFGFYDGQKTDSVTGGSNGVGKVIAFRFGIGFVVYYSVTKDGQSRFVIAFMDDGIHKVFPKRAMPDGAAWWGKRSLRSGVVCVEDETDIRNLLSIFGVVPYDVGRSGTTTIIPFFDEEAFLRDAAERMPVDCCPWVQDFDSCIRFCLNQWYAPRLRGDLTIIDPEEIGNVVPYHWGRCLKNQQVRQNDDMQASKIFSLIRELYDVAVGEKEPGNEIKRITCPMRRNAPRLGITFAGENFGWVAVKKINYLRGEFAGVLPVLCALIPGQVDDENGESFIGRLGTRRGFMLYCRRHGMIVSYERDWDDVCYSSLPKPQEGEFYVGIFVVNSNTTVTAPFIQNEHHTASIDIIFRSFEKTDHYGWPRQASFGKLPVVSLLLRRIKAGLAAEFHNDKTPIAREPLDRLASLLGRFVSSSGEGFGDGPNPSPEGVGGVPGIGTRIGGGMRGGAGGGGAVNSMGRIRFQQGAPIYELVDHQTLVSIPITIGFPQRVLCATIVCSIVQDGSKGVLYADDFTADELPVKFVDAFITEENSQVSIKQDSENLSVTIRVPEKTEVKAVVQYILKRRDVALAIDCMPEEKEGM